MRHVQGPDFPTGGIILGRAGIQRRLETGRGIVRIRGKAHIEALKEGKEEIVVTEIPFIVNRAGTWSRRSPTRRDKKLDGICDLRDESDKRGIVW